MLFDTGRRGMVEVDVVIHEEDRDIGIKNPDDFWNKIMYINWGKQGCTVVRGTPPKIQGPEERAKNHARLMEVCNRIIQQVEQQEAAKGQHGLG